jgi:hypothetical protein
MLFNQFILKNKKVKQSRDDEYNADAIRVIIVEDDLQVVGDNTNNGCKDDFLPLLVLSPTMIQHHQKGAKKLKSGIRSVVAVPLLLLSPTTIQHHQRVQKTKIKYSFRCWWSVVGVITVPLLVLSPTTIQHHQRVQKTKIEYSFRCWCSVVGVITNNDPTPPKGAKN